MDHPKPSADCAICCDTFTKAKRAPITCKKCGLRVCRECMQKYILTQESLTQITCLMPDCDCIWDRAFLAESLTQVFMRKRYPERRGELLFQHEKSRFPETMPFIEKRKQAKVLEAEKRILAEELSIIRTQYRDLNTHIWNLGNRINNLKENKVDGVLEAKEFIRQCPVDNCRGFLSKQWKCKVCDTYVCAKCHVIKGKVPEGVRVTDAFAEHVCDDNDVKSVNMLKKDTKPCPSCGVPINKISGCDQMWCTQCQVAFSWRTGRCINGVIHNPHFYQWQRETGGGAPRVLDDVRCGGFPGFTYFRRKIYGSSRNTPLESLNVLHLNDGGVEPKNTEEANSRHLHTWAREIMYMHRYINHFHHIELRHQRRNNHNDEGVKRELRIKYILDGKSDDWLKSQLVSCDKRNTRKDDIFHVLQLMDTVAMERFIAIVNEPTLENVKLCYHECHRVREYCNNELKKISAIDGLMVPIIQDNFSTIHVKFSKKDVGW